VTCCHSASAVGETPRSEQKNEAVSLESADEIAEEIEEDLSGGGEDLLKSETSAVSFTTLSLCLWFLASQLTDDYGCRN